MFDRHEGEMRRRGARWRRPFGALTYHHANRRDDVDVRRLFWILMAENNLDGNLVRRS
jgi:hypothetical protein